MSDIMTLQHWLKYTDGGRTSVRSSQLKAVDTALKQYHKTRSEADRSKVASALVAWMQTKGTGWKTSVRNKYHAVDDLYKQVMALPDAKLTGAEMVALSHVQHEAEAILESLFLHKRLEWRAGFIAKLANNKWGVTLNGGGAAWNSKKLAPPPSGGPLAAARKQADDLFKVLCPPGLRAEVLAELGRILPDFMGQMAAALVPFAGIITAAGGTIWNAAGTLVDEYRIDQTEMHLKRSLSTGEPEQAVQAMIRMIERERNADAFAASVSLGELCGKLAGALADGGTATTAAVGLAANVAKLGNIIRIVVRDVQEKNAANKLMRRRVTIAAFDTSPVLGAYYVCCAPTSVLVNQIFERFKQAGWRGDVERTVPRHIEPLREQGRRLIREHRFVIPSLQHFPGVLTKNEAALEAMEARVGKSGMVGFGSASLPSA